jgi:Mrp family chromosome partitioning ATPase
VGKSSVTVNLAVALAAAGHKVGVVDADIYGHSVPRMLGVTGRPTPVEKMIMPPSARGVKVISIGMFTKDNTPVVWRGPMLHRALQQFLADVYWGDLDVLLLDLPPGTGDIAISVAQLLPSAELLVVTTPQLAAAEVAERAGALAMQTRQRIAGVIENMSYLVCAHCGEQTEVFGSGGGATVAAALSRLTGTQVPLLGQVPLDVRLREGGDAGVPLVLGEPDSPAALALRKIADELGARGRSLAGRQLGLTPRLSLALGGVGVVGGALAGGEQRGAGGRRALTGGGGVPVVAVHVVEQVLGHEPLGVQVLHVEVGELRSESFPQVVLGAFGDPAQVTQGPAGLAGDLRQFVRAEDDQRDHGQDQQLANGQIEHAQVSVALVRSRSRMSTLNRCRSSVLIGTG